MGSILRLIVSVCALIPAISLADECLLIGEDISFLELTYFDKDELLGQYCSAVTNTAISLVKTKGLGFMEAKAENEIVDACLGLAASIKRILKKDHQTDLEEIVKYCSPRWDQFCSLHPDTCEYLGDDPPSPE